MREPTGPGTSPREPPSKEGAPGGAATPLASGVAAFGLGRRFRQRAQAIPRGTARRVLDEARPYRGALLLFLAALVLASLAMAVSPLLLRQLIDVGIAHHRVGVVIGLAVAMAALALLDAIFSLVQDYVAARVSESLVFDLRVRLYRHVQEMPLSFFLRSQTGALISRLNTDVAGAQTTFTDLLTNVVGNAVTVVFALAVMATLSWPITLAALVLLPVFGLLGRRVGRRLSSLTRQRYDQVAGMVSIMAERFNVSGALLVKLFGRPGEERGAFEERAARLRNTGVRIALYSRSYSVVLVLGASLASILVYGWGGDLAARGSLQVGTLVALVAYLGGLYGPLGALSGVTSDVMTMLVSFDRVFELLDLPPAVSERAGAVELSRGPTTVTFTAVDFAYPPSEEGSLASLIEPGALDAPAGRQVLFEVGFTALPHQLVALVGRSGAGKTTIGMLVPRLYDVTGGAVRLDEVDVRDASHTSLRAKVGVVTQEAHLFHDTLRANLLYARPGASEDELHEVVELAQIHELVEELPQGLDTIVGERGHRLSGGERQRVAIARLLLKAPDVVVLDEATAHLDSESEAKIQQALRSALAGRTALVIAHRLSTVRRADLILVIDRGRIVERGRHEELLGRGALYAELYRTQFGDRTDTEEEPPP